MRQCRPSPGQCYELPFEIVIMEILFLILLIFIGFFAISNKTKRADPKNSNPPSKNKNKNKNLDYFYESNILRVVGISYKNEIGGSRLDIIKKLASGDLVFAMRDYNNPHHSKAVRIVSDFGCIGFLPRSLVDKYGPERYSKKYYRLIIDEMSTKPHVFISDIVKKNTSVTFNNRKYTSFNKGCLTLIGKNILEEFKEYDILLKHFKFGFGVVKSVNERINNGAYYNVFHPENTVDNRDKKYSYDIFMTELVNEVYILDERHDHYCGLMVESYDDLNKKSNYVSVRHASSYDWVEYEKDVYIPDIDTSIDEGYAEDVEWENRY